MRTNEQGATVVDSLRFACLEAIRCDDDARAQWFVRAAETLASGLPEAVVEMVKADVLRALRAEGRATR